MSKEIKKIIEDVKKDIKPDGSSEIIAKKFVCALNELLEKKNVNATAILGGSMAKNTFLKNDYDADVFIKFNKKYKGDDISKILENVIKYEYEYEKVKGSRNYFHIQKEFLFELVPVLDVTNIYDAENVIDMSPMHVNYFKEKGKNLEDEVRLLKLFMKANRVYGAESFINGFSGHVVDLLIIRYKSFIDVIKAASKWTPKIIIDLEKKLKDPLMELDKAKITGPLIIVDPVQENRNAAAALSNKCYQTFVKICKMFLNEPSKDYFKFKSAKEIIGKNKTVYEITINPLGGSRDIAGAKVLKILEFIQKQFEDNDFQLKYEWDFGYPARAYFLIKQTKLEDIKTIQGPPLQIEKHSIAFKEKHEDVFEKDGFLYANIKRKFDTAEKLFAFLIKQDYIQERCCDITIKKQ